MIWFFEKDGEQLEYEIRQEQRQQPFDLMIRRADAQDVEQLTNPSELLQRSAAIWSKLLESGWQPVLAPTWRGR
jgi:hypothetical protein